MFTTSRRTPPPFWLPSWESGGHPQPLPSFHPTSDASAVLPEDTALRTLLPTPATSSLAQGSNLSSLTAAVASRHVLQHPACSGGSPRCSRSDCSIDHLSDDCPAQHALMAVPLEGKANPLITARKAFHDLAWMYLFNSRLLLPASSAPSGFANVSPPVPARCLSLCMRLSLKGRPPLRAPKKLCVVVVNTIHEIKISHISGSIFAHDYLNCQLMH